MRTWVLFLLLCVACNKAEPEASPLPGIEVQGFQDFGKVIVGSPVGSTVTLRNESTEDVQYFLEGDLDFSFVPQESKCEGVVLARSVCKYKLVLMAETKGDKLATVRYHGSELVFRASAILPGKLSIEPIQVNIGTRVAGDTHKFTMTLRNNGDVRLLFPAFNGTTNLGVETQTCGPYLDPGEVCTAVVVYQNFVRNLNLAQNIILDSGDSQSPLLITGVVKAGEISGSIGFSSSPTQLKADGSTYSFQTAVLTDQYGNQIEDGLEASVSFYNLTDEAGSSEPIKIYSSAGRYAANFRTTLTQGSSVLSVNTFTSSGTLNFTVQAP